MNSTLTHDEINLMSIYNSAGTREGLIGDLANMRGYLDADEVDLLALTDSAIRKLRAMTDAEFSELDLTPDFEF